MAPLAHVEENLAVGADALWEVLTDFGHPQRLVSSIEACTVNGEGVGALRRVRLSSGRVIYERLLEADPVARRFAYEVLTRGDMPFAGITAYRARVLLTPQGAGRTRVSWMAEAEVTGPRTPAVDYLRTLYAEAIRNLAAAALAEANA